MISLIFVAVVLIPVAEVSELAENIRFGSAALGKGQCAGMGWALRKRLGICQVFAKSSTGRVPEERPWCG